MQVLNFYAQLLNEPHILIAGATGSGKSVMLNGLVYTAACYGSANSQFIFLDKKRVELSQYKNLRSCLAYADDDQEMIQALQKAVDIIEWRFAQMQMRGEKKFTGPAVYVVIDELADLMTIPTVRKQAVPLIQRISQIGRAAAVHLWACTQNPLREILPTSIKCNLDCRIGLRTASPQDSRNIIGVVGCERFPNPRTEHRACAYIRRGADLELVNVPTYPEQMVEDGLNQLEKKVFSQPYVPTVPKATFSILKVLLFPLLWLFGLDKLGKEKAK